MLAGVAHRRERGEGLDDGLALRLAGVAYGEEQLHAFARHGPVGPGREGIVRSETLAQSLLGRDRLVEAADHAARPVDAGAEGDTDEERDRSAAHRATDDPL